MPVGKLLNDGTIPTLTLAGLDAALDRFLAHDDSAGVVAQIAASQLLDRLLSSRDLSYLTNLANWAALAATDRLLLFDASATVIAPLAASELIARSFGMTSTAALATQFTAAGSIDPTNDDFFLFDFSAGGIVRVRGDVLMNALLPTTQTAHTSTPVTLNTTTDQLVIHSNIGATQTIVYNAPAAAVGMRYSLMRIADYAVRFAPNGTDTVSDGAASKYVELRGRGRLDFRSYVVNQWDIVNDACPWGFQP